MLAYLFIQLICPDLFIHSKINQNNEQQNENKKPQ